MPTIIDGTAGITFPNTTVQASAGQVLQVVNSSYATQVSNSTNVYADTGLTISITPKFATSKILCIVHQNGVYKGSSNTAVQLKILRNSTSIFTWETYAANTSNGAENDIGTSGCTYLDSPATTSSITYKTQLASYGNTAAVYAQVQSAASTITLMEIAG